MHVFQQHEESMKSKKLHGDQELILKNMIEAAEQSERSMASQVDQVLEENAKLQREQTQTRQDLRRREERLEQSSQRREERFREDTQRKEEYVEQEQRDIKERADRERKQAKEALKRRKELFKDEMRRQTESFERKLKDWEKQFNLENIVPWELTFSDVSELPLITRNVSEFPLPGEFRSLEVRG